MFKDFAKRIERDLKRLVSQRQKRSVEMSVGGEHTEVEVKVISHNTQRFAVWFGGSVLACTPEFYKSSHTKHDYDEKGPSICRYNAVFGQ